MLQSIAPGLAARENDFVLVSMAAGVAISDIQKMAGGNYPVIRIMPNIPASVGGGTILFDYTENVAQEAVATFRNALQHAGLVDPLPEKLIDAGSALSGCGPAFVDLFIEALADGGVACGLPRAKALEYAAQMMLGFSHFLGSSPMVPFPREMIGRMYAFWRLFFLKVSLMISAISSRVIRGSKSIAFAESKRRSTCSLSLNTFPLYARIPSKTPSPYRNPWSKIDTVASSSGTKFPLT